MLEYLQPRDGRPYPADARTNDVLHWQTTLVSRNTALLAETLRDQHGLVSDGVVASNPLLSQYRSGFIVRDPDGHALRVFGE